MTMTSLFVADIRIDGGSQPRLALDSSMVSEFSHDMRKGDRFPPVHVFHDGIEYWLADGFHRIEAAKNTGRTVIDAFVVNGTARDAFIYALTVAGNHPLSAADRRAAALRLLKDSEWSQWSDRAIGRRAGMDGKTVSELRASLSAEFPQMKSKARTDKQITKTLTEKPVQNPADIIPITRAPPAEEKPAAPRRTVKYLREGQEIEMRVPAKPSIRGKPKKVGTRAHQMLKRTPVGRDDAQLRELGKFALSTQIAIAKRISEGDSTSVKEAAEAIMSGAPVDAWSKAYAALMALGADDRGRLCRQILAELSSKTGKAG